MGLVDRLRETLKNEYGITTDEELLEASREQKYADIGIFISDCGGVLGNVKEAG